MIARANTPTAPVPASRLRYTMINAAYPAEYFSYSTPVTYGHNSAGANGVAAYSPFQPNIPEAYTSTGPVRIVWDRNNHRTPEDQQVRLKPEMAAMDGGNTTFFTADTSRDLDTLPNFFGTSAAAPTAASVAALVLQAKGGPGSVMPAQMRSVLQRSALPHDLAGRLHRWQVAALRTRPRRVPFGLQPAGRRFAQRLVGRPGRRQRADSERRTRHGRHHVHRHAGRRVDLQRHDGQPHRRRLDLSGRLRLRQRPDRGGLATALIEAFASG